MHRHILPDPVSSLIFFLGMLFLSACRPSEQVAPPNMEDTPPAVLTAAPSPVSTLLAAELDSALALQGNWQFQEALDLLERAIEREVSRPGSARDTTLAKVYHKAGISCYVLDRYEAAIDYFQRALDIREAVFSPQHPDVIRGYNNIGNVYQLVGERARALEYLHRSLDLQPEPPIDPYPATIRALGRIYDDLNDAYRAERYLELALEAYRQFYPDRPWEIAGAHTDLAYFYLRKENYEDALRASRQALSIRMALDAKQRPDSSGIAGSFTNISVAFEKMGELDSAMYYQRRALAWNQRLFPADAAQLAVNHNNIGYLHFLKNQYEPAETALKRAMQINQRNKDRLRLCDNLENLGNMRARQARYDRAIEYYHEALGQLLSGLPPETPLQLPPVAAVKFEPLRVMNNLYLKGKTLRRQAEATGDGQRLQLAGQHFDTIAALADGLRFSYLADDSKINLARKTKIFFEEAIKTNLSLHAHTGQQAYAERAFELAEKSKAIVLLEALKETRARQFAGLTEADRQRERALKQQIAELERNIYQAQSGGASNVAQRQEWQRALIETYETYEQFIEELEARSPDYYRLKYDNQTPGVADLQNQAALLGEQQALLEYFVGEEAIYAFIIGRDHFAVKTLPLDFALTAAVDSMRQSIQQFMEAPEETLPVYLKYGHALYRQLWAPLAASLPEQVIVVPDDVLGLLPFEALLTRPAASELALNEQPYLIKSHRISYHYSSALLYETLQRPAARETYDEVLAFAPSFEQRIQRPPTPAGGNPIADNSRAVNVRRGLQPLFFNEEEVERIGEIAAARIYTGRDANKQNFRQMAPDYRFLHIATHGLADDEEPDYSFIAFSQPADTILLDEVLLVNELYNLRLNAEMVVLSACETGVGKIQRGEGIISLARGFSFAGVRSIITTLWNISDQRSNDLMAAFYRQLRDGKPKDAALRQAKMAFVGKNGQLAHPYFWAGFVPLGDMSAVEMAPPRFWSDFPVLPAALVVLAGIGIAFRRRFRSS